MSEEVEIEATENQEATATPEIEPIQNEQSVEQEATATPEASDTSEIDPSGVSPDADQITDDQAAEEEIQEAIDWEKRYRDQESYIGRQSAELHQFRKEAEQYKSLGDPDTVRTQLQQFRETAEKQQLKQWNPRHPDYAKFQSLQERARSQREMLASAETPEEKEALIKAMGRSYSEEERALVQDFQKEKEQTLQRFTEDPQSFIQNSVTDIVRQELEEYQQYMQSRQETERYLTEHGDAIQRNAEDFSKILAGEVPRREVAAEYVAMKEKIAELESKLGGSLESQAQAEAQSVALKQRASVERDLNTDEVYRDPVELANEKGLMGNKAMKFIEDYNKKHGHLLAQ